ncbi:(2Fe-2S) ferredoxin domain-containing protein [Synechococcus sp. RSCCF101]|uniref:(2Fe-2S) ferredoxin domain-containing protein n=1 Tax=Synechococcus sp. RSCCF101 TaxID=2511069 RepID=UPI001248AEBF|nr:(2Fe-2S) ferredoxin domain-containing protein [Synechococcus sp. RSCCF101]QEY32011.1 (2Fe-2S) ferredoxin domain-containing protein [Synechococcus sp. RSCCF101]
MNPADLRATGVACHLLLCATPTNAACCDPAEGARSWARLKQLVRDLGLEKADRPEGRVLRSKVDCLRVCRDGPVLLIWPDGHWYGGVTPERMERIIHEHVIGGRPVTEFLLAQTPWSESAVNPV